MSRKIDNVLLHLSNLDRQGSKCPSVGCTNRFAQGDDVVFQSNPFSTGRSRVKTETVNVSGVRQGVVLSYDISHAGVKEIYTPFAYNGIEVLELLYIIVVQILTESLYLLAELLLDFRVARKIKEGEIKGASSGLVPNHAMQYLS